MSEFRSWVKFRKRRGSLHPGMRVERAMAMLAAVTANLHRNPEKTPTPYNWKDFALHEDEEAPISLEEAMSSWA
ncbi:phage tail assembly protein T [Pseudomonas kurunegalensis]|uniref:phage tail assembly protein T n=1 Tax=Pseudomonas kurunegalensis TaxID=485880 RepID=UPI003B66D43C